MEVSIQRLRRKPVHRRIEFIQHIGFPRRHKWSMPFTVDAYRIKHVDLGVSR
jgi:hypothetical protein